MPAPESVALAHYRDRRRLTASLITEARRLWRQMDTRDIRGSWERILPELLLLLIAAQRNAAAPAEEYLLAILAAQDIEPEPPLGAVVASALAGVASDGRDLDTLLDQAAIRVLAGIAAGETPSRAMTAGYAHLDTILRTQVADAGRVADEVAMTTQPAATGYVRMVVGRTCGRCVVLAGRWYRYNAGFLRHPRCDCVHIPSREAISGDLRTSPRAFFDSLSREEQDRQFTKAGAEAIRLGADISQVVNARRGAYGLTPAGARITAAEARALRGGRDRGRLQAQTVFGQQVFTTTEGTTTRGVAGQRLGARETGVQSAGDRYRRSRTPRLMPESILQAADGNRDEAVRLLRRFGYIR